MRQKISFPVFVFCFAAAGLAAPAPVFCAPPQRRPSVVLVSLCSLRADHTSPYGCAGSAVLFHDSIFGIITS
jgi:predicted naringenin-chalcone synthase